MPHHFKAVRPIGLLQHGVLHPALMSPAGLLVNEAGKCHKWQAALAHHRARRIADAVRRLAEQSRRPVYLVATRLQVWLSLHHSAFDVAPRQHHVAAFDASAALLDIEDALLDHWMPIRAEAAA